MNTRGMTRLLAGLPTDLINLNASTYQATIRDHLRTAVFNLTTAITVTLPKAVGSGTRLLYVWGKAPSSVNHIISRAVTADLIQGTVLQTAGTTTPDVFAGGATDNTLTFNGGTTGGFVGDWVELIDVATNLWVVRAQTSAAGTNATPFSHV